MTPTVLVIFGATGDLVAKKIVPALFHLFQKKKLPPLFRVIGFSRQHVSYEVFRQRIAEIVERHETNLPKEELDHFLALFSYEQGQFQETADYRKLAKRLGQIDGEWKACANKLFYMAVPPELYEMIFKNMEVSGLSTPCGPDGGWTRIVVEKPIGKDATTAEAIDELLGKIFEEHQIYRIDHYLGKEMVQNILTFRFSNDLFEHIWSNKYIESIHIRLLEKIGVESRGDFYDPLGALRDVGQNHLLQMLAFITMDHPVNFEADAVRSKRAEMLKRLKTLPQKEIATQTIRGQYEGYRSIDGVEPNSTTETYFRIHASLSSPRWKGVPIILEGGKKLAEPKKDITVTFKHTQPCLCPAGIKEHHKNRITFTLEPQEGIMVQFWSKKPGLEFEIEQRSLDFLLRKEGKKVQYVEEYEKLLLDCIAGDQTLFLSTDEVKAMWKFIDPIVDAWKQDKVPLHTYRPNTNEILEQTKKNNMKKELAIFGLGKMGAGLAKHLLEQKWRVVGWNRSSEVTRKLIKERLTPAFSIKEAVNQLARPRVLWVMVPAGKVVDEVIFGKEGLIHFVEKGDIIIDGGNSFFKDAKRREKLLSKKGVHFFDVGVSGGPRGARNGACIMIGGKAALFKKLQPLFQALAKDRNAYQFFPGVGAGHFVKMVHNGIEYGMMQAIAEGFAVLKKSRFKLNLRKVAEIYQRGSVIESRLVGWMKRAFELHGENLKDVSGSVRHTGEGEWTVKTAKELGVPVSIIEESFQFRVKSAKNPSYTGKILSALREQFGGHSVKKE